MNSIFEQNHNRRDSINISPRVSIAIKEGERLIEVQETEPASALNKPLFQNGRLSPRLTYKNSDSNAMLRQSAATGANKDKSQSLSLSERDTIKSAVTNTKRSLQRQSTI